MEDTEAPARRMLDLEITEKASDQAEVGQLFRHSNSGAVAGDHVIDDFILQKYMLRVLCSGVDIYQIASLKHGKDVK